jgi:hypothetical protein
MALATKLVMLGAMLWTSDALAGSGRVALGLSGTSGINPIEPTWQRPMAGPSAIGCLGFDGWWLTGGHTYAGPRGEVRRTPDDERWGINTQVCPTSGGGAGMGIGGTYGRQWGGALYVTLHNTAGISFFGKQGPKDNGYMAIAPYVKPELAMGLSVPPGMSVEVGPYAWIAPPLVQAAREAPAGMYVGHFGLEVSVLLGAASPQKPWAQR